MVLILKDLGHGKVPVKHKDNAGVVFHSHPERPEEERHPPSYTHSDPGHPHHVSVELGAQRRVTTGKNSH